MSRSNPCANSERRTPTDFGGLSEDVLALARSLKYTDAELLEAVDSFGLVRTFGHLRREAEKPKRTDIAKSPVMVH